MLIRHMLFVLVCAATACDYSLVDPAFDLPAALTDAFSPRDGGDCYPQQRQLAIGEDAGTFATCEEACAALDPRWSSNLCASFVSERTCLFGVKDGGAGQSVSCTVYYPGV